MNDASQVAPWWVRPTTWRTVTVVMGLCAVAGYGFLVYHHGSGFGRVDLQIYQEGSRIALDGDSPYGLGTWPYGPFLYPPFAVVAMAGFTVLPFGVLQTGWAVVSVASVFGIARIVVRRFDLVDESLRLPLTSGLALASLALAPVWLSVVYGQVNIVLALLVVADTLVRNPRWPRGLLVGIAIGIKLTPAVFVLWWLLTGRRREAVVASVTFAATVVAGLLLMGDVGVDYWTNVAFELPERVAFSHILNQSAYAMFLRFDTPEPRLLANLLALPILAVGLWRSRAAFLNGQELVAVAICGATSVLLAPISWVHHSVWIAVTVMVLVGRAIAGRDTRVMLIAGALALATVAYFARAGDWWVREQGWILPAALVREWFFFIGVGTILLLPAGARRYAPAHLARTPVAVGGGG